MQTWTLEEILQEIEKKEITAYQIHKATGLSQSGLGQIINGSVKKPSRITLNEITKYLIGYSGIKNENVVIVSGDDNNEDFSVHINSLKKELMSVSKEGRLLSLEATTSIVKALNELINYKEAYELLDSFDPKKK